MQPDLPASAGLPLPKRYEWVAMATVSGLTAQESKAIVPKPMGGMSEQGDLLYPLLNLRRQPFPLECNLCESMWAIPSESIAVMLRDVQRDL